VGKGGAPQLPSLIAPKRSYVIRPFTSTLSQLLLTIQAPPLSQSHWLTSIQGAGVWLPSLVSTQSSVSKPIRTHDWLILEPVSCLSLDACR
ncbi:unnamed protein product, partial [Callosobruchus maculatus]